MLQLRSMIHGVSLWFEMRAAIKNKQLYCILFFFCLGLRLGEKSKWRCKKIYSLSVCVRASKLCLVHYLPCHCTNPHLLVVQVRWGQVAFTWPISIHLNTCMFRWRQVKDVHRAEGWGWAAFRWAVRSAQRFSILRFSVQNTTMKKL